MSRLSSKLFVLLCIVTLILTSTAFAEASKKYNVIGIDLGLSFIYVGLYNLTDSSIINIYNDRDNYHNPSVIGYIDQGSTVGEDSYYLVEDNNNLNRTITDVIYLMGRNFSHPDVQALVAKAHYTLIEKNNTVHVEMHRTEKKHLKLVFSIQRMLSLIIKKMRTNSRFYNDKVNNTVIAIPQHFYSDESRINSIISACNAIQITLEKIISKPEAAVIAYKLDSTERKTVLVVDFATRYLELSLVEVYHGEIQVKSSTFDYSINSDAYVNRIVYYMVEEIIKKYKVDISEYQDKLFLMKVYVSNAMRKLSTSNSTEITSDYIIKPESLEMTIDVDFVREKTEDLSIPVISKIKEFLAANGIEDYSNLEVILVGGILNFKHVKNAIEKGMNKEIDLKIPPEYVVSHGAAELAFLLGPSDDKSSKKTDL